MPTAEIYQKMSLYRVLAIISSKFILMFVTVAISKFFSRKIIIKRKYIIPLFGIIAIFIITLSITFIDIKNKNVNSVILHQYSEIYLTMQLKRQQMKKLRLLK